MNKIFCHKLNLRNTITKYKLPTSECNISYLKGYADWIELTQKNGVDLRQIECSLALAIFKY